MKRNSFNRASLSAADLFAGAGGLSVGFHMAGFSTRFFNEIEKQFATTYSLNFPDAQPFVCPIEKLSADAIRKEIGGFDLDVMVGGPPCQGYSINAPVRSTRDPRNNLFQHYVRLVLEGIRPKVVVLENVPGLVSFENGKTLEAVKAAFEKAGYKIAFRILNAAHYGVPEERWRLIIIGSRLPGIEPSLPAPTHYSIQRANFTGGKEHTYSYAIASNQGNLFSTGLKKPVTVGEAISDLPPIESGGGIEEMDYIFPPQNEYQRLLRHGSEKIWNHICSGMSAINFKRMKHIKPGGSWRDIPHQLLPEGLKRARRSDHTKRYGRLDPARLSGTVMTKCDPHWGTFVHYDQDRIISVREAARFQSFPDWFRFTGSKGDQYKQVGNAVPPLLAFAIANHIKKLLHGDDGLKPSQMNKRKPVYAKG